MESCSSNTAHQAELTILPFHATAACRTRREGTSPGVAMADQDSVRNEKAQSLLVGSLEVSRPPNTSSSSPITARLWPAVSGAGRLGVMVVHCSVQKSMM